MSLGSLKWVRDCIFNCLTLMAKIYYKLNPKLELYSLVFAKINNLFFNIHIISAIISWSWQNKLLITIQKIIPQFTVSYIQLQIFNCENKVGIFRLMASIGPPHFSAWLPNRGKYSIQWPNRSSADKISLSWHHANNNT